MRRPMRRRLCAFFAPAVLAVGAAGCGSDEPAAEAGKGVDAGAAVLRAELTSLLVGHAHLTGQALIVAPSSVSAPQRAVAAQDALTQNAAALGDALASTAGTARAAEVVARLRRYDDAVLAGIAPAGTAAADGTTTTDAADASANTSPARRAAVRAAAARAFATAAPGLRPRSAAAALADAEDVRTALGTALGPADAIGDYSARMPDFAEKLAGALVRTKAGERLDGDPGAGAAELRSQLAAIALDHTYGLTTAAMLTVAGDGAAAAREEVDACAVRLGELVTSVFGQDAGAQARAQWRALQAAFLRYTRAKAVKDDGAAELALEQLDQATGEVADVLSTAIPTLRRADVLAQLQEHVAQVTGAIRAITAGSAKQSARVQAAAGQSLAVARVLAVAIQEDEPASFPAGG